MNLEIDMDALQSYLVEEQTIQYITNLVHSILQQSDLFSLNFEIERLKFGTEQPSIQLLSMKDVDVTLQWHLITHDFVIPLLKKNSFQAPFQCVIGIDCKSDISIAFNTTLSLDAFSPGCIKFPIKANLSRLLFNGALTMQYLGDSMILFFETPPEINFDLEMILGAEEKLFDQNQIKDFLLEVINDWIKNNVVHPNALKLPFLDEDANQ